MQLFRDCSLILKSTLRAYCIHTEQSCFVWHLRAIVPSFPSSSSLISHCFECSWADLRVQNFKLKRSFLLYVMRIVIFHCGLSGVWMWWHMPLLHALQTHQKCHTTIFSKNHAARVRSFVMEAANIAGGAVSAASLTDYNRLSSIRWEPDLLLTNDNGPDLWCHVWWGKGGLEERRGVEESAHIGPFTLHSCSYWQWQSLPTARLRKRSTASYCTALYSVAFHQASR